MKRFLLAFVGLVLTAQPTVSNMTRTVTTAGTRVQLSTTALNVIAATIQAKVANTGNICLGGATVLCSTGQGVKLTPGASYVLLVRGELKAVNNWNLANIYLDSTVNGEGVDVTYFVQ